MSLNPNSSEIAKTIRQNIKRHHYDDKERLPSEREMAEAYGASRNTVRSALKMLAKENLLEIRRGSGAYVRYDNNNSLADNAIFEHANPIDLMDARTAMEPHICRLAAFNARRDDIVQMEELLKTMEASATAPEVFAKADTEFHSLLARSTGNILIRWFIEQMNIVRGQQQWKQMRQLILNEESITGFNKQHREIVSAIRERMPEKAADAMKAHLRTAHDSLKNFT